MRNTTRGLALGVSVDVLARSVGRSRSEVAACSVYRLIASTPSSDDWARQGSRPVQQTAIRQLPQGGRTLEVVDAIIVVFTRGDGNGCVGQLSKLRLLELTGFECFGAGRIRCQQPKVVNLTLNTN